MFNDLVIKNISVMICLVMRRQNLSLRSTFPIKLYHNNNFDFLVNFILFHQPEEDPTVGQISEKNIQCYFKVHF